MIDRQRCKGVGSVREGGQRNESRRAPQWVSPLRSGSFLVKVRAGQEECSCDLKGWREGEVIPIIKSVEGDCRRRTSCGTQGKRAGGRGRRSRVGRSGERGDHQGGDGANVEDVGGTKNHQQSHTFAWRISSHGCPYV